MNRNAPYALRLMSMVWRCRGARHAGEQLRRLRRRVAMGVGAVLLGLVALLFAAVSDRAQGAFGALVTRFPYAPLALTPALFAAVVWVTRRAAPYARGSGIPQVIAASRAPDTPPSNALVSLWTASVKLVLTVVMLLGGASVGREGPTVQISAAIMVKVHRYFRVPITSGVLIAGGAAGVAAAFNTPLAGVAFAIEELAAAYEQKVAVLVMGAVMIAGLVSLGIAGDYVYFGALHTTLGVAGVLTITPVAGVIGGMAGGLFSRAVLGFAAARWRPVAAARAHPLLLALGCGLVVAVLGVVTEGATWDTGYGATRALVEGQGQSLWFGPAKFIAALATTLSGAPGGIFAPSLAVGAGLGNPMTGLFGDQPAGAVVLLGMTAYFVGVVRAPLTAVIIVMEATAAHGMILPLFATALIADAASTLVCRERLYHGLAKPFVALVEGKA